MRKITERGASSETECDSRHSTKLLVSVRSAAESLVALDGGASFIDVKEPANGSLGRASRAVQVEVISALRSAQEGPPGTPWRVTVTAALGELLASSDPCSYTPVQGISLYKLGLSRCRGDRDWGEGLDAWRELLKAHGADLAAVAYADHATAGAPTPRDILDYAIDRRLSFLLVDTWGKETGSLTDFLSERDLRTLLEDAHHRGVSVALAGSLRFEDVRVLAQLGPDVVAVRGAACRQGRRELDLDPDRIRELVRLLPQPPP